MLFPDDGQRHELIDGPRLLSLRDGDVLETPAIPGLEVPLATVFEESSWSFAQS